uniref:Uncharacterized protein n=1 Tax=Sphaerodactylus townsendi TaxID=933632 RepID=A0ACB8FNZ7_9SAUR
MSWGPVGDLGHQKPNPLPHLKEKSFRTSTGAHSTDSMASGSFTPPRESFARSSAEGTRGAKGKKKQTERFSPERSPMHASNSNVAGREEGPPAPKKKKKEKPQESRVPPKGAAVTASSRPSPSDPLRAAEHSVVGSSQQANVPPAPAERDVDRSNRQVPGPSSDTGGRGRAATNGGKWSNC